MRFLSFFTLLISLSAAAEIVAEWPNEREKPSGVTSTADDLIVKLGTNSVVHFYLSGERGTSVEMTVAGRRSVFQLDTCTLSRKIHTDGMELERNDLRQDEHRGNSFTLLFDTGTEKDRSFGVLPRVQLTWTYNRLMVASVTRQVAANSGTTLPLCYPDVQL